MHNSNTVCVHKQKIKNRPKLANNTNTCNIYNSQPTIDGYVLISNNLTNICDVNSKSKQTNVEVEMNRSVQGTKLLNPDAQTFVPNICDISVDVVNVGNNLFNANRQKYRDFTISDKIDAKGGKGHSISQPITNSNAPKINKLCAPISQYIIKKPCIGSENIVTAPAYFTCNKLFKPFKVSPSDDCKVVTFFAFVLILMVLILCHMLNMVKDTGGKNYPYNENLVLVGVDESIGSTGNVDDISILSEIRRTNLNNVVIGFLNINSYRNKYEALKVVIQGKIDVMVLVETKLDSSFPTTQFLIEGYAIPFRRDRCNSGGNGGGILIYVREDIPCRLLDKHIFPDDIEGIFIELNFRKSKMLLLGTYHPPNQVDNYYFKAIGNALDIYNNIFDKCILVGDFNAEEIEVDLSNFLEIYGLKNIVHEKTCFKSLTNPTCIDLLLTNCSKSFQNTTVVSSGISDFHKMVVTVMKTTFPKVKPKQIFYRDYKRFNDSMFKDDLKMHLNANIEQIYTNFGVFQELFLRILDKHAPFKTKYVRANEVPYMTKTLRKAIMTRSRLEHKYQKTKSSLDKERFNKHKNFCNRLYKRERKNYYESLNLSHITDNKKFWKIMKPFLTDKGVFRNNRTC